MKKLLGVLNLHLQKVEQHVEKNAKQVSLPTALDESGTEELPVAEEDESPSCISVNSTAAPSQPTQVASLPGDGGLKRPAASSCVVEEKPVPRACKRPASASGGGLKKAIGTHGLAAKPFLWLCESHCGHREILHSEQEKYG